MANTELEKARGAFELSPLTALSRPPITPRYYGELSHRMDWNTKKLARLSELINPSGPIEIQDMYDPPKYGYNRDGLMVQTYASFEMTAKIGRDDEPSVINLNDQLIRDKIDPSFPIEEANRRFVQEISYLSAQGIRELLKQEKLEPLRAINERLGLFVERTLLATNTFVSYGFYAHFLSPYIDSLKNGDSFYRLDLLTPVVASALSALVLTLTTTHKFSVKPEIPLGDIKGEDICQKMRELSLGYYYLARHGGDLVTYRSCPEYERK